MLIYCALSGANGIMKQPTIRRRQFTKALAAGGALGAVALAGCADEEDIPEEEPDPEDDPVGEPEEEEPVEEEL